MKTLTTYSPTERITWRVVGGVRVGEVHVDEKIEPEPKPEPKVALGRTESCPGCGGEKQRRSRLCFDCTYGDGRRCLTCDARIRGGRNHCKACASKSRTEYDPVTVEHVLAGEWGISTTRADRLEVVNRWTGSLSELSRLTGWNVWRLIRQARPTEEVV